MKLVLWPLLLSFRKLGHFHLQSSATNFTQSNQGEDYGNFLFCRPTLYKIVWISRGLVSVSPNLAKMHLCHIFLLLMCVWHTYAHCDKEGSSVGHSKCDGSEYNSYLDCVQKRRNKRQTRDCHQNCDDCNCEQCQHETCSSTCTSCCESYQPCQTNYCCHKTCHSQCQTSHCRSQCKKDCRGRVNEHNNGRREHTNGHAHGRHNATTHIRTEINVHNMINNTNIIDVPINVTTLNFNNITLINDVSYGSNGSFGNGGHPPFPPHHPHPPYPPYPPYPPPPPYPPYPTPPPYPTHPPYPPYPTPRPYPPSPCCVVATPQVCRPQISVPYVSCSYRTQRVCQNYCDAPVVHPRVRYGCQQESGCENSVYYSQQPGPTCAFQPSYPYFGCGVPNGPNEASGGDCGAYGCVGGGYGGGYGGPGGEVGQPYYGDYQEI